MPCRHAAYDIADIAALCRRYMLPLLYAVAATYACCHCYVMPFCRAAARALRMPLMPLPIR